eukprot:4976787-Pyramimonas_sp.AAC.1
MGGAGAVESVAFAAGGGVEGSGPSAASTGSEASDATRPEGGSHPVPTQATGPAVSAAARGARPPVGRLSGGARTT